MLLLDEIDTLIAVLRQLRAGYDLRPESFPQSVVLCGVRDVRDYRIRANSQKDVVTGGSAFNIKAESLRMGDFSEDEMRALLAQHTGETGQAFAPDALECLWTRTRGQPWLVNALAHEVCFRNEPGHDGARAITAEDILEAQEQLVVRRVTYLDQLADKLREARVRRVVEPLLSGGDERPFSADDLEYVRDLGLIARDDPLRIANPIYAEVVPREITYTTEAGLVQETTWYMDPDGDLDVVKLLEAFRTFFREHSEHWVERFEYREAGPQLLLQAFLHRIVNGGGRIERECGLGRGRTDLLIVWPATTPGRTAQKVVVECKVMHPRKGLESTIEAGLVQTAAHRTAMSGSMCGACRRLRAHEAHGLPVGNGGVTVALQAGQDVAHLQRTLPARWVRVPRDSAMLGSLQASPMGRPEPAPISFGRTGSLPSDHSQPIHHYRRGCVCGYWRRIRIISQRALS